MKSLTWTLFLGCTVEEFLSSSLQPGLHNPRYLCYLNSTFMLLHRIQFKDSLREREHGEDYVMGLFRYHVWFLVAQLSLTCLFNNLKHIELSQWIVCFAYKAYLMMKHIWHNYQLFWLKYISKNRKIWTIGIRVHTGEKLNL